ncbi:MAG TPA: tRNA dihydrouridine synthase DusB [Steroidobacteraceae bacterium]|nr:tRNA dihydrouridine synthase DusB [Steroidobacteraceae bacterium]
MEAHPTPAFSARPVSIGPYILKNNLALAPMAGVTDLPFRNLCRDLGAGIAATEMLTSDARLWNTNKSQRRMSHRDEPEPRIVQIAGGDPAMMIDAAQRNVDTGAQIIDINMGCPTKKVCNKAAGSSLLRDEELVARILEAVVAAVSVPVTLKIRTGWSPDARNGVRIAKIAEQAGIQALAVHGRTRACMFGGEAEYETIAAIKNAVRIPIFANGDIDSPQKAKLVLEKTGADGLMIGRSAQGNPWIFREVDYFLHTGNCLAPPSHEEVRATMRAHLRNLYAHYGDWTGIRVARKHIAWYARGRPNAEIFRAEAMQAESVATQLHAVDAYFADLAGVSRASSPTAA